MPAIPRISILVRTRNRAVFLRRSLRSIAEQTFRDWQAVIIDQGDPEVTRKVLAEFPAEFQGKLLHLPVSEKLKLGAMFNRGLEAGKSDLVVCLDDDDTWAPSFLEKMEHALREKPGEEYGGVACHAVTVFEDLNEQGEWSTYEEVPKPTFRSISIRELLKSPVLQTNALMWERRCLDEVGYYSEEMYGGEDWNFHMRFICKYEIAVVEEALARYHRRPRQQSQGPVPNFAANSPVYLRNLTKYDLAATFDACVRGFLEADPSRLALLQYLGQMERAQEKRHQELTLEIAAMDRRLRAASEKIGKIDSRTKDLKIEARRGK